MSKLIDADLLGLTDMEIILCDGNYKEALKMLIDKINNAPTIEPEPKWIPCSKKLPQPNERHGDTPKYYLVQNEFGDMMVARFRKNRAGESWWEQMYAFIPTEDEIVAWMPLPRTYMKEGDE